MLQTNTQKIFTIMVHFTENTMWTTIKKFKKNLLMYFFMNTLVKLKCTWNASESMYFILLKKRLNRIMFLFVDILYTLSLAFLNVYLFLLLEALNNIYKLYIFSVLHRSKNSKNALKVDVTVWKINFLKFSTSTR